MPRHGDASRFTHPGFVDLTGTALAGCVVLERAPNVSGNARWHVIAACGHMAVFLGTALRAAQKRGAKIPCADCRPKRPGTVTRRADRGGVNG